MKLKLSLCVGICYLFVGAFSASIELKEDENYLPAKGFVCSVPSLPETRAGNTYKMWPEGKVYYEISQKFDNIQKDLIKSAMKRIEAVSCVRFHEVENCEKGCIYIDDNGLGSGCSCYVGYDDTDKVRMNLQRPGCVTEDTIVHELTHGLGRNHEQCRADQSVYVTIDETNIEEGKAFAYQSYEEAKSFGFPYDYDSIMHYRRNGFAIDRNKIIIVPKYWETSREADNSKMSLFDIKKLNTMYNCTRE